MNLDVSFDLALPHCGGGLLPCYSILSGIIRNCSFLLPFYRFEQAYSAVVRWILPIKLRLNGVKMPFIGYNSGLPLNMPFGHRPCWITITVVKGNANQGSTWVVKLLFSKNGWQVCQRRHRGYEVATPRRWGQVITHVLPSCWMDV